MLVLEARGGDAAHTLELLRSAGLVGELCRDLEALCDGIEAGAGCAIACAESLDAIRHSSDRLSAILAAQAPWSDFPFIIVTSVALLGTDTLACLGNVTLLEAGGDRPVAGQSLLIAVTSALRARGRQYEARSAIDQRDQFLAMLGHELRNPLGVIVLASELASAASTAQPEIAVPLTMIGRQARHLSRLVDDLLDVARVTYGRVVLQRGRVDLGETIDGCIAAVAALAREHGVTITHVPAPTITLDGDGMRLAQVFDNLLTNAIKYTRAGGTVRIEQTRTADHCEIRVRDTGIGISAKMLPRIFELFAQADGGLDRSDGGMGIGLTLVKRLVELHDGTVVVASDGIGTGSEFTVQLPIHEPVSVPVASDAAPYTSALRVVLIDDNEDIRELSRCILEQLGCIVEVAADGPDGLAQILRVRPDLALIDIGLPGMDGFAVAERVRATLGVSPVLVAITGYGQDRDRDRARTAGFDVHLTKPVRIASLREMIDLATARAHTASATATALS